MLKHRPGTIDELLLTEAALNEYDLPDSLSGQTVLDVGACIGTFAATVASRGAARVLAFEPNEDNYRLAVENTRAFSQVEVRHAAVWKPGVAHLVVSDITDGETAICNVLGNVGQQVAVVSLDEILEELGVVDLAKFDCEGSEYAILMNSDLLRRMRKIVGEYHNVSGHTGLELAAFLSVAGYRVSLQEKVFKHPVTGFTFGLFSAC